MPVCVDVEISIHALREEGDGLFLIGCVVALVISIHALREEGDCCPARIALGVQISIHALREEGDHCFYHNSGISV